MKSPKPNSLAHWKQAAKKAEEECISLRTAISGMNAKLQMAEMANRQLTEANRMWMGHTIILGRTIDQISKAKPDDKN